MVLRNLAVFCGLLLTSCRAAHTNTTAEKLSRQIFAGDFKPPQVFENVNLVRTTNLDKGYVRETINVVVANVDAKPQSEYYLPFEYDVMSKVGGIEVRDKMNLEKGQFEVQTAATSMVLSEDGTSSKSALPRSVPEKILTNWLQINPILHHSLSRTTAAEGSNYSSNFVPHPLLPPAASCFHQTRRKAIFDLFFLCIFPFWLQDIEAKDES